MVIFSGPFLLPQHADRKRAEVRSERTTIHTNKPLCMLRGFTLKANEFPWRLHHENGLASLRREDDEHLVVSLEFRRRRAYFVAIGWLESPNWGPQNVSREHQLWQHLPFTLISTRMETSATGSGSSGTVENYCGIEFTGNHFCGSNRTSNVLLEL